MSLDEIIESMNSLMKLDVSKEQMTMVQEVIKKLGEKFSSVQPPQA